jgi:predicted HicB family RNase H-like nuclease
MQMAHHIQAIQEDLAGAAAVAPDESTAEAGRRLTHALASSLHLRLLDVLTEVAAELSASLPGRVDVRLAGREPELVYVEEEAAEPTPPASAEDGLTARITLRLPEPLKAQIEIAASREGLSINAWIIRALTRRLERKTVRAGRRLSGYAES